MPIYEYQCRRCQERFELLQAINEGGDNVHCPKCNTNNPQKVLSVFSSGSNGSSGASCSPSGST